jgi:colicin import membrane protein
MIDNRAMSATTLDSTKHRRSRLCATIASAAMIAIGLIDAHAQTALPADTLRQQFPAESIDSVQRADAALAATNGAKARVEKDYKAAARECVKKLLVNACLDEQRSLQRKRLADIDGVELEANRFKRRDRADHLEAERAKREADRAANAKADAELRAHNRKDFEDKQAQAKRDAAQRARSDAIKVNGAATKGPHKPAIKVSPPGSAEADAATRSKNATQFANKVAAATQHREEIERRMAAKEADRKKRAEAKAAKDAKTVPPAAVTPSSTAGSKP